MNRVRRPLLAFAFAWIVFAIAAQVPTILRETGVLAPIFESQRWLAHAILKTLIVLIPFGILRASHGSLADWGFTRPRNAAWLLVVVRGGLLGAITSIFIVLTPARGMTWMIRDLGFAGMILWVWLYSSVTEEIFVRGWFQSFIATDNTRLRVILSAALFGSMHLLLFWKGVDPWTASIVVVATTLLGFFAALDRERTGSLLPPIATHIAFNVGAPVGGAVAIILRALLTGSTHLTP